MKPILIKAREKNNRREVVMEKFIYLHTYTSYLVMCLLVPVALIACIAIVTTLVMLPLSMLCGWC